MDALSFSRGSVFMVGEVTVDAARNTLRWNGESLRVEPKLIEVLSLLACEPGRVYSREEVLDAVWPGISVGDESLTRVISQLRKALSIAPAGRDYIETVPKRGYRLAVEAIAAASEDEPAPETPTEAVPVRQTPRKTLLRLSVLFAAGTAIVAAGALALNRSPAPHPIARDVVEIAAWRASGDDASAFADAMPMRLAHELQQHGVATIVAFSPQADGRPAPRARGEFRLSGAASAAGAVMFLEDSSSGAVLWSHRVASKPNLSQSAEGLAARAAAMTECGLFRRRLINRAITAELLAAWIRNCELAADQNRAATVEQGVKIAAMAPNDAASHSSLAFARLRLADSLGPGPASSTLLAEAQQSIDQALSIDPGFTEALLAKAEALPDGDYATRERLILEAGVNDPSYPWQRSLYVRLLREVGRLEDATHFDARTRALKRTANVETDYAWLLAQTGDIERARRILDETAARWPGDALGPWRRFNLEAFYGDTNEAEKLLLSLDSNAHFAASGGAECWMPYIAAKKNGGDADTRACSTVTEARIRGALGDVDGAIADLEQSFEAPTEMSGATIVLFYPELGAVRRDARFAEILRKTSLPAYWGETGRYADFCAESELPYKCADIAATE